MTIKNIAAPGVGYSPKSEDFRVYNRTGAAVVKGDVLMLDLTDTDAGSTGTDATEGSATSSYASAILPTTAGIGVVAADSAAAHPGSIFCVVLDDSVADDGIVNVRVRGFCDAKLTNANITIGMALYPANGTAAMSTVVRTAGVKCIAMARETNSSTAGVYKVNFNGEEGFGSPVVS